LTLFVNQIGNPSPTVQFSNGFAFIGNERKFDPILVDESLIFLHTIAAYADDLRIQFCKFFQITLEG
jgi:hypothetical protein